MATTKDLADLHSFLAEELQAQVKSYKERGEDIPANLFKEIREFLKDNHIEADGASNTNIVNLLREVDYGFEEVVAG